MKKFSLFLYLFFAPFFIFSQTSQTIDQYVNSILADADSLPQIEQREKYIKAAQIKEVAGDLKDAEKLYRQASLVVNGIKDFESLYKASVLNTEMAFYDQAEADLKAIMMFSNDDKLRKKAVILDSKIHFLNENFEDAANTLETVLKSDDKLSEEALVWIGMFIERAKNLDIDIKEISQQYEIKKIKGNIPTTSKIMRLFSPESIFFKSTNFNNIEAPAKTTVSVDVDEKEEDEVATGIQVGSFSVKENADELKTALKKEKMESMIIEKTINGKKYYSVIVEVKTGEDIQRKMIGLKEKGYEGYPIY